jgi:AcrR family transcriptional regulator
VAKKLNEKQMAAIAILTEVGNGLTYEEVAKRVGVDVSTLRRWRNEDDFNKALMKHVMNEAVGDLPRIMRSIPDHIIGEGNAAMFRTYMQSLGLLTEKVEVDNKNTGTTDIDAMKAEIERMRGRKSEG